MYCKRCGTLVGDDRDYCEKCSKELDEESMEEVVVEATTESSEEPIKEEPKKDPTNIYGILSLVSSILGILGYFPFVGPILGVIFGRMSKNSEGEQLGKIGLIIGVIGIVVWFGSISAVIISGVFAGIISLITALIPLVVAIIRIIVERFI